MGARVISGSWVRDRGFTVPRLLPRRLRSLHTVAVVLLLIFIGWVGWLWYRSSSFVKVERVTVTGLSGPDVPQIRDGLTDAALQMTTLNVNISKLESAVEQYAYVQSLTISRRGDHGVVIKVSEQVPVALVSIGGNDEVVDAHARLLPNTTIVHGALPIVPIAAAPAGTTITAAGPRDSIAVLAAAPYALLPHLASATSSSAHGVIVQLRNGPQIYFGTSSQLHQKWEAAAAVLQNHGSAGASYIDVSDPQRPAAGAGVSSRQAGTLGLDTDASTTTPESSTPAP
ncbi:MAG TPA: cell division protein FtsQ/DivIB [Solirubrobacteraceae bacterium]|nr:cell division protein FtsQ/DivIB [Solirubrobacteraceae bacterium]